MVFFSWEYFNYLHVNAGVYISVQKRYWFPPSFWKWFFPPLATHQFFLLVSRPFCLNSTLLCFLFPLLLPLFSFSFPFLPFSFPFLPFSFTYSPLFSSTFHFFPPNNIGWYYPPTPSWWYFPIYRPLCYCRYSNNDEEGKRLVPKNLIFSFTTLLIVVNFCFQVAGSGSVFPCEAGSGSRGHIECGSVRIRIATLLSFPRFPLWLECLWWRWLPYDWYLWYGKLNNVVSVIALMSMMSVVSITVGDPSDL